MKEANEMGYLTDTFSRFERVMKLIDAPEAQCDTLRAGFYLGAKTFMEAAHKSAMLDESRGHALLDGCRTDIEAFQAQTISEALSLIARAK
jgi:hypothetical protein